MKHAIKRKHEWVPSTLGHGETMCKHCHVTNREYGALKKWWGEFCEKAPLLEVPDLGGAWKHKNGHTYTVLGACVIEATTTIGVLYTEGPYNVVWVRPYDEFMDGRFTQIPDA